MRALPVACLIVATLSAGCAGTPGPGDPGYPYNVEGRYSGPITLEEREYEAVIRMATAEDGTVSGSLGAARLDDPGDGPTGSLEGDFTGSIREDGLVWRSSWIVLSTGCSGILRGRGPVEEGGGVLEGEVRIAGDCRESAAGHYRLTR